MGSNCSRCELESHNEWRQLNTVGDAPCARSGQGAVVVDDVVYIFGGCDGEAVSNDIRAFYIHTSEWQKITHQLGPSARTSFGICLGPGVEDVTVACGCNLDTPGALADIWSFNVRHRTWTKRFDSPRALYGVSVCWNDDNLLMYGGSTGVAYSDTLYAFSLKTGNVAKIKTSGEGPSERYKQEMFVVDENLYMCGGGAFAPAAGRMQMFKLNLTSLSWHVLEAENDISTPRAAFSCCVDSETSKAWIFGGFSVHNNRLQAFQTFDIQRNVWNDVQTLCSPPPRAFHSMVLCKGSLLLLLGSDGDKIFDDVWKFCIRSTPPSLQMLAAKAFIKLFPTAESPAVPHELRVLIETVRRTEHHYSGKCKKRPSIGCLLAPY
ncbi:hypothetical protein JKP88DRAFT_169287 [Tribonema minus]|uniref:Uncharacterized protein n=1 Tax=Tribonema minus TaxID=303371 RepID=A0A835YN69_9STRA|nr:hypothetical protein JKP88DRAFT_169287 [Tribonema minus]